MIQLELSLPHEPIARICSRPTSEQIIQAYRDCGSIMKAARKLGIGTTAVAWRVKEAGISKPQTTANKTMLGHLDWADVGEKYVKGWGFKRLADHFGVSRFAMNLALRNRGLKRPYAERTITAQSIANVEKRAENYSWRARELRRENAVWNIYDCWVRYAYKFTKEERAVRASERYYANHEASKLSARTRAKERWSRLRLTGEWKIRRAARNAVARIARMVGSRRKPKTRTFEFLGCDYETARRHIESLWGAGMSWANHGKHWEIDHIKPLAAHNLLDERERMKAMHYTNLQPLTVRENREKSDHYTPCPPPPVKQFL